MKISTKLFRWYDANKRDLPWRRTRDPYKILVSEIMLQQTQVDRVVRFYKTWLKQFPTFKKLAQASNADVIRAWSGLGYNRRALALRDIARQVTKHGMPPQSREAWLELKGVGPYTSSAIALFAQGEKTFPVDSIIRRVMGRVYFGEAFSGPDLDFRIQHKGEELLDETRRFEEVPQALFDLGSKICSKDPKCSHCPLKGVCKTANKFLSGEVLIPRRSINKGQERIHHNKPYPDRIYRGRILKVVKAKSVPVSLSSLPTLIDKDFNKKEDQLWFNKMIDRLVKDELLTKKNSNVSLPV